MADLTLDTRGLRCPLPILKAKKSMLEVPIGGTLTVLTTDPGAADDFQVFADTTGHILVESCEDGGTARFVLRRTR